MWPEFVTHFVSQRVPDPTRARIFHLTNKFLLHQFLLSIYETHGEFISTHCNTIRTLGGGQGGVGVMYGEWVEKSYMFILGGCGV